MNGRDKYVETSFFQHQVQSFKAANEFTIYNDIVL